MSLNQLRLELDQATHGFPRKHIQRIEDLKKTYPHHIRHHGNPNIFESDDCFLYAFRNILPDNLRDDFINLIDKESGALEEICRDLITEGFVSLHDEKRDDDKIVVYFNRDSVKHFGMIDGDRVVSKWGRGYTWKHDLFEVPLSYGYTVKFSNDNIDQDVFRRIIETHSKRSTQSSPEPYGAFGDILYSLCQALFQKNKYM